MTSDAPHTAADTCLQTVVADMSEKVNTEGRPSLCYDTQTTLILTFFMVFYTLNRGLKPSTNPRHRALIEQDHPDMAERSHCIRES